MLRSNKDHNEAAIDQELGLYKNELAQLQRRVDELTNKIDETE
jgi:hypothetical protein